MNIGFDLDKVFVNYPPFVPGRVIEWFYRKKINGDLSYRIPSKPEQVFRLLTHYPILRKPIKENIDFMKSVKRENKHTYYLVSSRFGFLKKITKNLVQKHEFYKIFKSLHFNFYDEQPHHFKNRMIKKLKIDRYIDDDLPLLNFLSGKNPNTKFYWLNKKIIKPLKKNLVAVKHISEILK